MFFQVAVLIQSLKAIVDNGNTVVVVEHDPTFIRAADYLIEMGPGAGRLGGQVIYQGPIADIDTVPDSVTYRMLHEPLPIPDKPTRPRTHTFGVQGAFANNLQHIDIDFYAAQLTAVTGVSGSGKSSLIKEVLHRSWLQSRAVHCTSVHGLDAFAEVLLIDQELISTHRLSTPASYTGVLDLLKPIFAKTDAAVSAGLQRADFSYLSKVGKCPLCAGHGQLKTSMDFMSDIWLLCDACHGLRYHDRVLACSFRGRSIGDVLRMTVSEAMAFFDGEAKLLDRLAILLSVGLSHLVLGQSAATLSGGEAQRLKLASAMMGKRLGPRLFLFDEPSVGLHYFDVLSLIDVFRDLVELGDTVIFIEHNAGLVGAADRVVRLGPGSGVDGGTIV